MLYKRPLDLGNVPTERGWQHVSQGEDERPELEEIT
jgi:hypothetical protein